MAVLWLTGCGPSPPQMAGKAEAAAEAAEPHPLRGLEAIELVAPRNSLQVSPVGASRGDTTIEVVQIDPACSYDADAVQEAIETALQEHGIEVVATAPEQLTISVEVPLPTSRRPVDEAECIRTIRASLMTAAEVRLRHQGESAPPIPGMIVELWQRSDTVSTSGADFQQAFIDVATTTALRLVNEVRIANGQESVAVEALIEQLTEEIRKQ